MLQLLKISPQNPLMRLFGLSKKDVPAKDYEALKNDPHQPFARFTNDENGNERMEFAIRQVERDGQEPAFGYKGWTSADPRALDNGTKNAMINVTNQIMGDIHAMYHGADAAKSEMSESNSAFYRSVADEVAQDQKTAKPFDSIQASYDDYRASYAVNLYGDFSDRMFPSIRNELIETGHLFPETERVPEHIRIEVSHPGEGQELKLHPSISLNEDAYNYIDNLHREVADTEEMKDAVKTALEENHHHYKSFWRSLGNELFDDYDHTSGIHSVSAEDYKYFNINSVSMEDIRVEADYIEEAGVTDVNIYYDFGTLEDGDRASLMATGHLKTDENGSDYISLPAIVSAYDSKVMLGDVSYEGLNAETSYLLNQASTRVVWEESVKSKIIESQAHIDFEATRPEQVDLVSHSDDAVIETPSYDLNDFRAKQISDSEMDVTLPKLELLDTEYQGTIDELYESGHLIMREDGTSVLRIEHDENGKILDADETTGFDKLPYRSQILLEAIHSELGHEIQATVDRELKEEVKDNVVSHHGFLKENRMHQSGYLLLSVEGSDWKDVPEADMREQGLSIANGKWAAKFTLDESGKPIFESRATSEVGKEFERQHLDTHASVIDWNCSQRHEQIEAKRLAQAEAYADKNGFILKSEGEKFALLPKSQFAAREDGLKSVMATVGTTAHFAKLQSLSELKTVMREAKALDKAHHKQFNDQKMPFNVVTQRGWDFAVRKFEANDKLKSVSVKTTAGDKIQLMRPSGQLDYTQRDLGITSKNAVTGQTGQRVVVNGTREHSQAVQNSMIKDGIYINKSKDGYVIGHLQEHKPRFFEKSPAMALRAAVVTKNQVAHEKQVAAQRQVEATRAKEQEKSSAVMSA